MTRSQARFALAVKRTESRVFTAATFTLPRANMPLACSVGRIEVDSGEARAGGGGRTAVRKRTMSVRRPVLLTTPPVGQTIKLTVEGVEEIWEVESFTSDAVLWMITLKAAKQS